MALQTDLNVAPYYDDFDPAKKFYRVLFQPSVALQARELNQLQSILQNQIEKFGDNVFKRGTIIEGCNIVLHSSLPFVKLKDTEADGTPVNISSYQNLYVKNSSNVTAFIVKTDPGFESQSPNLNTLYVKYINSGDDSNTTQFSANTVLTVYDPSYPIFKYIIADGSSDFSNTDTVVVVSAIAIQNSTGGNTFAVGGFAPGHVIQNGIANAVILETNATANSQALLLKVRPLANNLQTANSTLWRFLEGETITNLSTANTARISSLVGSGAEASLVTDTLGKITSIAVTNSGQGYYYPPHVAVSITSNSAISAAKIAQLSVTPQNFKTTVRVAPAVNDPIGVGYGLTVDEGTIYQKGFFSKVDRQLIVVNKYSNTNFTKSVGFYTEESIIDSNEDQTLLDNATGTYNYTAPGADRLYLNPVLRVLEKNEADANSDFFPIMEFADGKPYKQNKKTVYNIIGDEMAKRTYEESGDYVLDQFSLITKDSTNISDTKDIFKIYIDPGVAYLKGYRVATASTYSANVSKGTSTETKNGATVKIAYGNFIKVDELVGYFKFHYADRVELYSAALDSISSDKGVIAASGSLIGYARMRNLVLDSGTPGTAAATYRLYLFDIEMNAGKNFADVRSVIYKDSGSVARGAADIKLTDGAAVIEEVGKNYSGMMVKAFDAVSTATGLKYIYRTLNASLTANTSGGISVAKPSADEFFPYSGELSTTAKNEILLTPTANYKKNANSTGTVDITSGQANIVGTTTTFLTDFRAGDFIQVANVTSNSIVQIRQVVNNTLMFTQGTAGLTISGNAVLYFPNNVPIILNRTGRSANVTSTTGALNIFLGTNLANTTGGATSANVVLVYNVTANNVSPTAKNIGRGIYARLRLANNSANVVGPWALGVPDAFRLRGVWKANTASVAKTFNANTGVNDTTDFITITNNPFSVGDSVTYSNTAGTTVVGGLANGSSYFVVYANSSGVALSSSYGGANLNITANSVSENHTLTGLPLYFTETSYGVTDVTNDYYIDHNQTEDFLDISYLYLKPNKTKPTTNDTLLVKFDVFTSTSGGKTASSYSANDTISLATLVASNTYVNTMEIPEVWGKNDVYYDLRDQIDFRPSVANTVVRTSTVYSNTIVNPGGSTATDRLSTGTDWKFPLPNSDISADITYYVGRNDRVILDTSGNFNVVTGAPNVLDVYPPEPKDSMTIQYLIIPPYPSLPQALSPDMVKIIDTKVINEKTNKRISSYTVTAPLDRDQVSRIQVKNYQMVDIAALEKRIKALEDYITFTLAEVITNSMYIPSSIDGSDRFKFGFFVDQFVNYNTSDVLNPEFYATIEDNRLTPKRDDHAIEFVYNTSPEFGGQTLATLGYEEYNLLTQGDATDGPVPKAEPPGDTGGTGNTTPTTGANVSINTVTQTIAEEYRDNITRAYRNDEGTVFEEFIYTFSSLPGPARIYWQSNDNRGAIEIFQADSEEGPWTSTHSSAVASALTTQDRVENNLYYGQFNRRLEHAGSLERFSYGPVGGWIEDHFKTNWEHDPAFGRYVKVRVYKGDRGGSESLTGTFTYKIFYPSDTITSQVRYVADPDSFDYVGVVYDVNPPSFVVSFELNPKWIPEPGFGIPGISWWKAYFIDAQRFIIAIVGLKPNTDHKFYFDNQDKTSSCYSVRGNTPTAPTTLRSDENGTLVFDYYYDAGIDEATSDFEERNKLIASVIGEKQFKVSSADGNSFGGGTITIKSYINREANQTKNSTVEDQVDQNNNSTPENNTRGGGDRIRPEDLWIGPDGRWNDKFVKQNFGDVEDLINERNSTGR